MLVDSPIWDFLESWRTPNCYSNKYDSLPKSAGVYLLVAAYHTDQGLLAHDVVYVGMSRNIFNRFKQHEVKKACELHYGRRVHIKVYFKRCSANALRRKERNLIKKFNPPFNLQHRVRGVS